MAKNLKKFNILRPILAILLIFIPLYPKFPLFNVKNTYVAIRLDDVIVALSFIIFLSLDLKQGLPTTKKNIFKLFLPYFAVIVLSVLNAIFILKIDHPNLIILHAVRKFQYMSLFFLTIKTIKTRHDLSFSLTSLTIASIFVAIYGFGQKYLSFPIISTMNEEFSKGYLLTLTNWSRISSTFAGHYDLAAFLSVFLVILAGSLVLQKNKGVKIIASLIWLGLFYLLTLTASRVSIFSLWGGLVACFLLTKKFIWIIPSTLLILYSMTASVELNQRLIATLKTINPNINFSFLTKKPTPTAMPTPTLIPPPPPSTKTITQTKPTAPTQIPTLAPTIIRNKQEEYPQVDIDAGVSRSGQIRFNVEWPAAFTAFKKNIFIGTGPSSLGLATDNNFLRILGETGLFGLITFAAIPIFFSLKTYQTRQTLNYVFFASMLTFFANAIFIDVLAASKIAYLFWIMMGLYYQSLILKK